MKENIFQANDSRVESSFCAYTVIRWNSCKRDGIILSIKGIVFFLKVWYNTDKLTGSIGAPHPMGSIRNLPFE